MSTRQQRRAQEREARKAPPTIGDFVRIAAGWIEGCVVTRPTMLAWLIRAEQRDPTAVAVCTGITRWLKRARAEVPPPQCLGCRHPFAGGSNPEGFAVAIPAFDPCAVMITGICPTCAQRDDLAALAMDCWRAVWPDIAPYDAGRVQ